MDSVLARQKLGPVLRRQSLMPHCGASIGDLDAVPQVGTLSCCHNRRPRFAGTIDDTLMAAPIEDHVPVAHLKQ